MHVERQGDHWRLIGGPVPPGSAAITLGSVVSVRARWASDDLLARHEAVHVHQWRTFGVVGFLVRYLGAYLRLRLRGYPHVAAYRRIPLEIEAGWVARGGRTT
jgi:hypothetical protein